MPETQAVLLLSGAGGRAARSQFDQWSDFDVALVIDIPLGEDEWRSEPAETYALLTDRVPPWLPNFSFAVPTSWGTLEVNVNQLILQYEADPRTSWDESKCEAYSADPLVIVDHGGQFRSVIERKCRARRAHHRKRLVTLAARLEWDADTVPRQQEARGDLAGAHLSVTTALQEFIELGFVAAGLFLPNKKWRLSELRRRAILGGPDFEDIDAVLRCTSTTRTELDRRILHLGRLMRRHVDRWTGLNATASHVTRAEYFQLRRTTSADEYGSGPLYDRANFWLAQSQEIDPPEWPGAPSQSNEPSSVTFDASWWTDISG